MSARIAGEWRQIAGNPNLGAYTTAEQQPVDFAVWQAADGRWQLWSCIRHTACGGQTRLLYRWESADLHASDWRPMGIAMEADPHFGETPGGLQAPHVIREEGVYYMFYGDWARICLASSRDGKHFTRLLNEKGDPGLFSGPYGNTRDPMVLKVGVRFYCYYMGHVEDKVPQSAVFCRTSTDLRTWSEPSMVAAGGIAATQTDWYGGDCECPFVVHQGEEFILFRTQRYGQSNQTTLYRSPDPLDFGIDDDRYRIGTLPVAAPEIIEQNGEMVIAALMPSLDGIRTARLSWSP